MKVSWTNRRSIKIGLRFVGALLFAVLLFAISLHQAGRPSTTVTQTPSPAGPWQEIDRLVSEQKFEAALQQVEKIRIAAQKRADNDEWTRALIKEVQLRTGLHGYETAVRFLKEQPWPGANLDRAVLNLFYARSLVTYYQAYSWEINRRERVESRYPVDLKVWTRDQIYSEAQKSYTEVWKERLALGREPVTRLAEYLETNNYPKGIRGTLRDAVTYLYVELLADTSLWKPEETGDLYRVDLKALLAAPATAARNMNAEALVNPAIHPLVKIGYLLDDLEAWHAGGRRSEAALEARLERLRRLHDSFTEPRDRALIRADLEQRLPAFRAVPWWAMGKATQAEFVRALDEPGKLIRARAIAEEGWKAYPDSFGGGRCLYIIKSIEAPEFSLTAMLNDGFQKRSVEVSHRNLPALYFRAYPMDLVRRIETAKDYNLLPSPDAQQQILERQRPAAEWSAALPATPDYESHRTFVTPPMKTAGCYLIAASTARDFSQSQRNRIMSTFLIVSDIVLLSTRENPASLDIRVLAGESGRPVSDAQVALYKYDWQSHHQKVEEHLSDPQGQVRFSFTKELGNAPHFIVARKGSSITFDANHIYFYQVQEPREIQASLIYTDRSVYRPLQKLYWKVLAYGGSRREGRFRTLSARTVTVSLLDPNGQKVDSRALNTNDFGTAAGEFTIPAGRLLGAWRLASSLNGQATVRVEEYKRPTFEVTLKDADSPLRLNRTATFTGEAKYYFGLPVARGAVRWRATMEPLYPWWWDWYGWWRPSSTHARTIATGAAELAADGSFKIRFTPQADEREGEGSRDVTYRYQVSADLTDEGGETRSASRSFRLGFVSVEATIEADTGFFLEKSPGAVTISRADLNGAPRAGRGSWRLVSLRQPEKTSLPADQPLPDTRRGDKASYRTPGDSLRPRWNPAYSDLNVMRVWPDGGEIGRGSLNHNEKGKAVLALPALNAGAYRLHYETVDDFGATCRTSKDLIVAGQKTPLALPALLVAEKSSLAVGEKARFLAHSGLADQMVFFELWRDGRLVERRSLIAGRDAALIEIPIQESDRGGFSARLSVLSDYQLMRFDVPVFVPWDNKELKLEFSTFRDKLRPGAKETWRVRVKSSTGANVEARAAELLAYMYDKSLDIFAPHNPPNPISVYPTRTALADLTANLGQCQSWALVDNLVSLPDYHALIADRLKFYDGYGIGGPGRRFPASGPALSENRAVGGLASESRVAVKGAAVAEMDAFYKDEGKRKDAAPVVVEPQVELRSEFAETAFWQPQLRTDADGSAGFEFTVPDSVTSWNVWVHAVTRGLDGGSLQKEAQSFKDLMVRPYLPRFLREADQAGIKVVVNNASERELSGQVKLDILDPETNQSLAGEFGLKDSSLVLPFRAASGAGANVTFPITAPRRVGLVAFKVTAISGDMSDGELRPVPLLPSRIHLAQSRFVTLKNKDRRVMTFEDLQRGDDPSLASEQLVVTLDAQLFYSVLSALPYLVNYPYECTEQTLNRFVSTGILSSLYRDYPAVARMAEEFSKRDTRLETWDAADPNRKVALEETPWLMEARGGKGQDAGLINVLDPRIARAEQEAALAKLRKAQTSLGGFPWFPGGPPSPYMTLYIMYGLAKAAEFRVEVPRDMVERGWSYLARHYREEYANRMLKDDCCWEFLTFLNYAVSCYPDPSWVGNALTAEERKAILNHSFKHWKQHSPYLKGMLALTLKRMARPADAELVFSSVMDSAKTSQDQGTFWAPEDRAWLWYNDTIETHAFALKTLMELSPQDARKDGMVQWLFLNKKLNHWKSTRATAEVIYSLVHYLKREKALAAREDATVRVGGRTVQYVFEPDKYTGRKNQTVIPGDQVDAGSAAITVEKESQGFVFASATWHFSTDKLPAEERGDFFSVSRSYFKRENTGREFVLRPLANGEALRSGDELEVHLSIRAKHAAEYVHLRDPRAAGLEPENAVSRYKWDLGISWYEETRDSATNFFFEWLPQGEYTFKYRLRANMAGVFRVGPATLQSMYAPEFNAYSTGAVMSVK